MTSVAEPYSLDAEALADLVHLVRTGFEVRIAAWRARHYRGHSVGVEIIGAELGEPSKGGRGKKLSPAGERLEKSLRSEFRLLYRGRAAIEPDDLEAEEVLPW